MTPKLITEAPDTLYAANSSNYAGWACTYADIFDGPVAVDSQYPVGRGKAVPVCWVPLEGGEVTQDDDTGDTFPTGITLTRAEVASRLADVQVVLMEHGESLALAVATETFTYLRGRELPFPYQPENLRADVAAMFAGEDSDEWGETIDRERLEDEWSPTFAWASTAITHPTSMGAPGTEAVRAVAVFERT